MNETDVEYFEEFYLLSLNYPWAADLINPHVKELGPELNEWLDTEYPFLSLEIREKYKQGNYHIATARMVPFTPSYAHISACSRFMIWVSIVDDYVGMCTAEEVEELRKRFIDILEGSNPLPDAADLDHVLAKLRDEYLAVSSPEVLKLFTYFLDRYIEYGLKAEAPFRTSQTFPKLEHYKLIREYCIGMYAYEPWAELSLGYVLPEVIEKHPVILRIRALTARIIGWQNDFYSIKKEIKKKGEVMNLVLILMHEQNIPLEQAIEQARMIHDNDVAEFVALQNNLPDFGEWSERTTKVVEYLSLMISGLNTWYLKDTLRYNSNHGLAEAAFVRKE
ncbi:terpene synthase family protein [Chryseobacterium polytrichastri]|uniref:Terpene synthase n=1 Tax=Chryseobacterium polytrichastri TaxID=1302687 RepID=A0A1M7KH16_9FLAO|nr:hypothetical protein [Chryseobacterium polytrichastri]SHM64168.1 hypothetical protein SAMN05444267_10613 [Chryseobacterium polytrichastri]